MGICVSHGNQRNKKVPEIRGNVVNLRQKNKEKNEKVSHCCNKYITLYCYYYKSFE